MCYGELLSEMARKRALKCDMCGKPLPPGTKHVVRYVKQGLFKPKARVLLHLGDCALLWEVTR